MGTPTSGRHQSDGDRQAAARLAGQHYLASPPDIGSRRGQPRSHEETDFSDYIADNELDSEISSLFGTDREARLQNLHLLSPMEYSAAMKQYTGEAPGVLGQDITPDSGVVVDSRHHSKVRYKASQQQQAIK